jgi:hypothetical protein
LSLPGECLATKHLDWAHECWERAAQLDPKGEAGSQAREYLEQTRPATPPDVARPVAGPGGWTPAGLMSLAPDEFEMIVALAFQRLGYQTTVTQSSRDEGIDVKAERKAGRLNTERIAVQCKRQASPVGRPQAQALIGAVSADPSYSRAVLVGVSGFSPDCLKYAAGQGRLELWDGEELCEHLNAGQ